MVKVYEGTSDCFYMDGYLHSNLVFAKEKIKDDWDFLWVVDGGERKGKSVLAQQIAKFCYPDFSLKNIVFTPKQFTDAVMSAEPFTAIVYDEAYGGINSRSTMSLVNKSIVKMLTEIGSRNLFIIIVLPCFFDLDKYVSLWRSKALFHIYIDDNLNRGYFMAFNEETKKDLYILGKKFLNYNVVKSNFYGRFSNHWVVDKVAYEKKKRKAQLDKDAEDEVDVEAFKFKFIDTILSNESLTHNERIRALNIPESTYYYHLRNFKKDKRLEDKEETENII